MSGRRTALAFVSALATASPAMAQGAAESVPLYPGLGAHTWRVTATPAAQRYFDQGLRLVYAFGRRDAAASFRQAARLDPRCAMCWWGVAVALGPSINGRNPGAVTQGRALESVQRAESLAAGASALERALIEAQARRWAPPGAHARRGALDTAYADAMRVVAQAHADDADVQVLFAEALEVLRAWDWYDLDGTPRPGTDEAIAALERALALDRDHPGACHYYIHAVEQSLRPERAEACADRLGSLMPGASHIVHMPGHIYLRLGRYADAIRVNRHAHDVDDEAARDGPQRRARGVYPGHNLDFLRAGAMWDGQSRTAVDAARMAVMMDSGDAMAPVNLAFVYARFGRWNDLLALPARDARDSLAVALRLFTVGLARLRTGDAGAASRALDSLRALLPALVDTTPGFGGSPRQLGGVAVRLLEGEIAWARRDTTTALAALAAAVVDEDSVRYNEPADWPIPAREYQGAVLLAAGRAAEAEAAYREDLRRNPHNGWSLFGLAASLRAQGKDARDVDGEFGRAWRRADVGLTASVF